MKQRGESAHLIAHTQSVVECSQGSADGGEDVVEEERGFGPAAEAHCLAALPHESGVAEERYFRRTQRRGNIGGAQLCNGFVGATSIHIRMNGGDVGRREATLELGQLLASAA